jgi:iron complex outermembrane receptor protein
LVFEPSEVASLQAPAVNGSFTVSEGFARLLNGTDYLVVAEANGSYSLRKIPVTSTQQQMRTIRVEDSELAVTEAYAGGQVARGSRLGILGDTDIMDTPFSTVAFTEDFARDVQAKDITDLLRHDASFQTSIANSVSPRMIVRGFDLTKGQLGINGLYGMGNADGFLDAQPFERAEVFKGPSSLLQGAVDGGVGGAVSMVTKRATDEPLTRLSAMYETEDVLGAAIDVGRRFGSEGEWGVRGNLGYRSGTFTDSRFDHDMTTGSLALDYRGERLRASLDYVGQRQLTEGTGYWCNATLDTDPDLSKCPPDTYWYETEQDFDLIIAAVEFDLNEHWQIALKHGENRTDDAWPQTYPGSPANPGDSEVELVNSVWAMSMQPRSSEANLYGHVDTGAIKHELVFGVSHYQNKTWDSRDLQEVPTGVFVPINAIAPGHLTPPPPDRSDLAYAGKSSYTGYALIDRLTIVDERYQLLLGLRHQNVKNTPIDDEVYDESAVTPSVGLIYKPAPQWMFYGSYIEDLEPGETAPQDEPADGINPPRFFVNAGEVFEPTRNTQYEIGSKWDSGTLGATAALFQITQQNGIAVSTGALNTYEFRVDGERRHRGLELSLFGELMTGTRLLSSYMYLDAELAKTEGGLADREEIMGVPGHRLMLNAEHDLRVVPGLTLTATMTTVSSANRCSVYLADPAIQCGDLPGYTLLDVGARYRVEMADKAATFRLTVQNLADKGYFGVWSPGSADLVIGEGRTVSLSAEVEL